MGFFREWFGRAMVEGDVNSRLVLLIHGITSAACIALLSVAFIFAHDRTEYTEAMYALVGGGGIASLGRLATKYGNKFKQGEDNEKS